MIRYFVYCRKSTEDEDHQVLSIESQTSELDKFSARDKLSVVTRLEEARSARTPGRPVFDDMLRRIERGEAQGIIAWHPDRLARNALDGGRIIHLLDTGKLLDLRFPTYTCENTSQGKFMLAIMFGQSKYYVDSLSENIRRGNRTKREKGWIPGRAPAGYVNARSEAGEKIVVPDPERFPILKRLWDLLLSGAYSVPKLLKIATNDMGLRSRKTKRTGGAPMSMAALYRLFSNPIYAGFIVHGGQWYPGKHEAMITMEQFEQAQKVIRRPSLARPKGYDFPYTGLIRCGNCGGMVTAEHKRNRYGSRYIYYRCTHNKPSTPCREKCVEARDLEAQILAFLNAIHLASDDLKKVLNLLEEEAEAKKQSGDRVCQSVEQALESCKRNLDNLTKLRYRELISDDEFLRQRAELNHEQIKLNERLERLRAESWIEPARKLFLFSNRAAFWLTHGENAEKRLILATIGSNPSLKGKILSVDARKPFRMLSEKDKVRHLWTIVNDVRTFFESNPEVVIPLLPEIPATHSAA